MTTKLFRNIKEGDKVKLHIDSDFMGNPIYQEIVAKSDAVDMTNEDVTSGYGFLYENGLWVLGAPDREIEILESKDDSVTDQ